MYILAQGESEAEHAGDGWETADIVLDGPQANGHVENVQHALVRLVLSINKCCMALVAPCTSIARSSEH